VSGFVAGEIKVTLERYAAGSWNQNTGYFDEGAKTEETIWVGISNMEAKQIERLVEGEQDTEGIIIESRFRLHTSESEEGQTSDFIKLEHPETGEEERYKIMKVKPPYYNRSHKYKAEAIKE